MAKNYSGITDTGKRRSNNEDLFIAEEVLQDRFIAAAVIDGVGGYEGGEVAAQLARDAILNALGDKNADVLKTMKNAFISANSEIRRGRITKDQHKEMACVLTMALVDMNNNKFYYTHVGDTRLYLLRDKTLIKITRDHSFVGFLEDNGRLTEDEAMSHPKRNEINRALGFDDHIVADEYIEAGESPFLPGDVLLLCSDGLSDLVSNSAMTAILLSNKSLTDKGKELVHAANNAGGNDNITVVLVQNDKPGIKQQATKPPARTIEKTPVQEGSRMPPIQSDPVVVKPKKSSTVSVLTVLCIILLGAFLWVLYQGYQKKHNPGPAIATAIPKKGRNEEELKLVDSITNTTTREVFVLNAAGGEPITITDSILIKNDSLHIIGNGVKLVADTAYKGPLLTLSASCKYILLDSLTIESFDVGILVLNKSLHLKNVQFSNCRVPVQYQLLFPLNTPVTGSFADTLFPTDNFLPR